MYLITGQIHQGALVLIMYPMYSIADT